MTIPPRRRNHARPIRPASRTRKVGSGGRGGWSNPSVAWIAVLALALVSLAGIAIVLGSPKTPASPGDSAGTSPTTSGPLAGTSDGSSAGPSDPAGSGLQDGPLGSVPIVPVVGFRSTLTAVGLADVRSILNGHHARFTSLELVSAEADPILAAIGVDRPDVPARLILAANGAALERDLAVHPDRLAFQRADSVTPAVRALAWGSQALFGVDRLKSAAAWVLNAQLPTTLGTTRGFNPAVVWTMVAGGDILLDRGVARAVKAPKHGVDFPFNGGTARIVSRHCCTSFGWATVVAAPTGTLGAVRNLLQRADLTLANFENPAPDLFKYHPHGTIFTADPHLIAGLKDAGIDYVSLGNDHIGDAGSVGLLQTLANLDRYGIRHSGAGKNAAAARAPAILTVDGLKVAVLSYDTIARGYGAGLTRPGSAQLTTAAVRQDVASARKAGAQIVIVYPHWGTEFSAKPSAREQALGHAVIDAGADLVIGNYSRLVGPLEIYKGHPIWYALGNFVFDQTWSEPTSEGLLLELTFSGSTLVQVRLRPTIILDSAQPNLLDPARDGRVVLAQFYSNSGRMLPW